MGGGDGAVIFPENIDINLCVYIFPRIIPIILYGSTASQKQEGRTDSSWVVGWSTSFCYPVGCMG